MRMRIECFVRFEMVTVTVTSSAARNSLLVVLKLTTGPSDGAAPTEPTMSNKAVRTAKIRTNCLRCLFIDFSPEHEDKKIVA